MRIEDVEQRLGQFRQIVVELAPDPCSQEGEGFDQPGDVRILDRILAQPQPAGDLRVRLRELRGKPADVIQFPVVVWEKIVNHWRRRQS